ncbi:hypothetical protein A1O3_09505 [Capronia epimyces CBS 606.96]|uniref:Zn(2)-C6 fungal-type domain-containing protein n=1 Tax=Capronia epimyces CBS 606.96 TaxID=1182542 RepID=W9Y7J3_9EURO|nr:uncharacterized protein A1O3_09505 [Capronia epimyces CBS 606.96]EXJ78344.1 hypothetical protein A1O3_09505 [Capronia epimyces CBS 606.96]
MAETPSHVRSAPTPTPTPAPAPTKRPRPVISCLECRRKKLKCDRTHPCQQCLKTGRPARCEYQAGQEPELNAAYSAAVGIAYKRPRLEQAHFGVADSASDARDTFEHPRERRQGFSPAPVPVRRGVIEDLQERVARLEHALLSQDQRRSGSEGSVVISRTPHDSSPSRIFVDEDEAEAEAEHGPAVRAKMKPRFPDACSFLKKLHDNSGSADMVNLRTQLQCLHHAIETASQKRRNVPVSLGLLANQDHHRRLHLPPFHLCEKLAVHYFDNLEHCFRILHWPEFRDQLKVFFTDGLGEKACRFGFIPQLVGVLAIAASFGTHPEYDAGMSYPILQRPIALNFINEFLRGLRDRQRYLLPALQVKMLVLMLNWVVMDLKFPIDDLFRLNGELVRDALVMKMDQDPSTLPGVSVFQGELRRRCWMTIIECDLMLSILCKLPCLVPPYTAKHPQNVNDEEIFEGIEALPQSRPLEEWTDGLCQYVLSQSFPRRLAACKQMDSSSPGHAKFQDVLLHTRYLERALQELPPPLRFSYMGDQASKTPPRLMARMELDISIRRPLMHLYSCCASAPNAEHIQQEARAGFLQSCLMLTTFQDLFDPQFSEVNVPRPEGYWDFFYNVYRYELGQAMLGLCLEIKRFTCAARGQGLTSVTEGVETESTPAGSISAPLNGTPNHGKAARAPALPYTTANMMDSVKDTLDSMKRRLLHPGASFKDLVYFNVVLTSVLPDQPGQPKEMLMQQALQGLVHDCRAQLEQEHVPIPSAHEVFTRSLEQGSNPSQLSEALLGPKFDPTWADFPDLVLLDSPGSYELAPQEGS